MGRIRSTKSGEGNGGSRNLGHCILHRARPSMKHLNQDKPILDDVRGKYVMCGASAQWYSICD